MDTLEKHILMGIAADMAQKLLMRRGVHAVHLIDTEDSPYFMSAEYLLFVVVDNELAERYKQRLANPATVPCQDVRVETQEAAYNLLGTSEKLFYAYLDWERDISVDISIWDIQALGLIDIMLVRQAWQAHIAEMAALKHQHPEDDSLRPIFSGDELRRIPNEYRVFEPSTHTFAPPR